MSKTTSLIIGLIAFAGHAMAQQPLYKQATAPVEDRVKDLIGRMTVEEKVGQLCVVRWGGKCIPKRQTALLLPTFIKNG